MIIYEYRGAVSYYNKVVANNWKAKTMADSKAKAINNFKYQFKKQSNLVPGVGGITLSGTIQSCNEKEKIT